MLSAHVKKPSLAGFRSLVLGLFPAMNPRVTFIQGDCQAELSKLPPQSVQCVVTSPPYFNLRDYGTAKWDGGDSKCDHKAGEIRTGLGMATLGERFAGGGHKASEPKPMTFREICAKCGARRIDDQIGLESSPQEYVAKLVAVFREVRRVLRDDGVVWINLGDSYAGSWGNYGGQNRGQGTQREITKGSQIHQESYDGLEKFIPPTARVFRNKGRPGKSLEGAPNIPSLDGVPAPDCKPKDMIGIPWRVAFALQADGWYLRSDIIWVKPNPMPESVTDRPTKSHEYIFLLAKSAGYFYDAQAIKEPVADSSIARISQPNFDNQTGGPKDYANGINPNRSMRKTVENFAKGRTGKNAFRGQGHFRDTAGGPTNRDGRDMAGVDANANGLRNKRDVWTVSTNPYSEAHFATFPPDLIKPCILAGTSAKGCCPKCGAPWERVLEKGLTAHDGQTETIYPKGSTANRLALLRQAARERGAEYVNQSKTAGWQPACDCGLAPIPCTILDPFGGSGTVAMVSTELGRRSIYIDLNPKYIQMAKDRCNITPGLALA